MMCATPCVRFISMGIKRDVFVTMLKREAPAGTGRSFSFLKYERLLCTCWGVSSISLNRLKCTFFTIIALLRLELALLVLRLRRLIMVKNLQFIQFNLIEDTP